MRVFGNLINRITENTKSHPVKDGGATITAYSDRYAGTVYDIVDGRVYVQEDKATRIDNNGMSDSQDYHYERDFNGRVFIFGKNRKGRYVQVQYNAKTNRWNQVEGGNGVRFGDRDKHYDFGF